MSKQAAPIVRKLISSSHVGVVVSAGRMLRTVKVRVAGQEWNKRFRKHFPSEQTHLVADPNNSLVQGDVVCIASGWRTSKNVRHVVTSIVAPFGEPVENRPPVLTEEQRMNMRVRARLLKDVRSAANGRQTSMQRLAHARKQGVDIPTLEEAMANVRLAEQDARLSKESRGKGGNTEPHRGAAAQAATNNERRLPPGRHTKEEEISEAKVKDARVQTT